jgi:hypothetical protein
VREFVENPDRILRELRASPGVATVDTPGVGRQIRKDE